MKKVSTILLMALVLSAVGVSYEAPAKKIASVELSKMVKSYVANAEPTPCDEHCTGLIANGVYQCDVYYTETTATDNYRLPSFEAVYIEPASPVPLIRHRQNNI